MVLWGVSMYNEPKLEEKLYTGLDRLIKYDWSKSNTKRNILSKDKFDLPILPLDLKVDSSVCDKLANTFDTNRDKIHQICTTTWLPDKFDKLTLYGPSTEDYPMLHSATASCNSWEEIDQQIQGVDLKWWFDLPEFQQFIETLPFKKIYAVEFRSIPAGKSTSLHMDREPKTVLSGLRNRLYIPITWNEDSVLACYGIGAVKIDVGRVYALNGNGYIHGARNLHKNKTRHAIIVTGNPWCEEYDSIIESSYIKYSDWL